MERIIVLDFGGQYCHLISRRIRELGTYCEVMPSDTSKKELTEVEGLKGLILSGGAASVYDESSPQPEQEIFDVDVPMLGICYGHQLMAKHAGGKVSSAAAGEYGLTKLNVESKSILEGLENQTDVWMNHKDIVEELNGFEILASTSHTPVAAFANTERKWFGVQFHPEVTHTKCGMTVLEKFPKNL